MLTLIFLALKSDNVQDEEIESPLKLVIDKSKVRQLSADDVKRTKNKDDNAKQLRRKRSSENLYSGNISSV